MTKAAENKVIEQKEVDEKLIIKFEDGSALVEDDGGFIIRIPPPKQSSPGAWLDFGEED